jgi:hypothetical protein
VFTVVSSAYAENGSITKRPMNRAFLPFDMF